MTRVCNDRCVGMRGYIAGALVKCHCGRSAGQERRRWQREKQREVWNSGVWVAAVGTRVTTAKDYQWCVFSLYRLQSPGGNICLTVVWKDPRSSLTVGSGLGAVPHLPYPFTSPPSTLSFSIYYFSLFFFFTRFIYFLTFPFFSFYQDSPTPFLVDFVCSFCVMCIF